MPDGGGVWRPALIQKPLSMDIRTRAMVRLDAGETVRAVALSVAPSRVVKWSHGRRVMGNAAAGKPGGMCLARSGR